MSHIFLASLASFLVPRTTGSCWLRCWWSTSYSALGTCGQTTGERQPLAQGCFSFRKLRTPNLELDLTLKYVLSWRQKGWLNLSLLFVKIFFACLEKWKHEIIYCVPLKQFNLLQLVRTDSSHKIIFSWWTFIRCALFAYLFVCLIIHLMSWGILK